MTTDRGRRRFTQKCTWPRAWTVKDYIEYYRRTPATVSSPVAPALAAVTARESAVRRTFAGRRPTYWQSRCRNSSPLDDRSATSSGALGRLLGIVAFSMEALISAAFLAAALELDDLEEEVLEEELLEEGFRGALDHRSLEGVLLETQAAQFTILT